MKDFSALLLKLANRNSPSKKVTIYTSYGAEIHGEVQEIAMDLLCILQDNGKATDLSPEAVLAYDFEEGGSKATHLSPEAVLAYDFEGGSSMDTGSAVEKNEEEKPGGNNEVVAEASAEIAIEPEEVEQEEELEQLEVAEEQWFDEAPGIEMQPTAEEEVAAPSEEEEDEELSHEEEATALEMETEIEVEKEMDSPVAKISETEAAKFFAEIKGKLENQKTDKQQVNHGLELQTVKIHRYASTDEEKALKQLMDKVNSKYISAQKSRDRGKLIEIHDLLAFNLQSFSNPGVLIKNVLFFKFEMHQYDEAVEFLINYREKMDLMEFHWLSFYTHFQKYDWDRAMHHLGCYLVFQDISFENEDFLLFYKICSESKLDLFVFGLLEDKLDKEDKPSIKVLMRAIAFLLYREGYKRRAYKLLDIEDSPMEMIRLEVQDAYADFKQVSETNDSLERTLTEVRNQQINYYDEVREKARKIEEENEDKVNPYVPANGYIVEYDPETGQGKVKPKDGGKLALFNYDLVQDEGLIQSLNELSAAAPNIPVLFVVHHNEIGIAHALYLQPPKRINELFDEVEQNIEVANFPKAGRLLELIQEAFPGNEEAIRLQDEILINKRERRNKAKKKGFSGSYSSYYRKGRTAWEKKEFGKAIKYFEKAIEEEDRLDSAVRDLAMTYHQLRETDKAITILEENLYQITDKGPTYNLLVNFSYSLKNYDQTIGYLKKAEVFADKSRRPFVLTTFGHCYVHKGEYDKAEDYLEQLLMYKPDDPVALKMLEMISNYKSSGDLGALTGIEELMAGENIEELAYSSDLSLLLKRAIKQNNYEGVPESVRASQNFTSTTLVAIRGLIEKAGRARPEERARFLLTEAKLMELLEPDKKMEYRAVLARYCNAMALVSAGQNIPTPVVRYYYLEAFNMEDHWDSLKRQVYIYLFSFLKRGKDLVEVGGTKEKELMPERLLAEVFSKVPKQKHQDVWDNILEMFIVNREITVRLLDMIKKNKVLFDSSVRYLNSQGLGLESELNEQSKPEKLQEAWLKMRTKRSQAVKELMLPYRRVQYESMLPQSYKIISEAGKEIQQTSWLHELDKSRAQIMNDITGTLDKYFSANTYDSRDNQYQLFKEKNSALLVSIEEQPTMFSVQNFIPLCEFLQDTMDRHFDEITRSSKPKIMLTVITDSVIDNNSIEVKLQIENGRESSPIQSLQLFPVSNDDCKPLVDKVVNNEVLRGGEKKILPFRVHVSPQAQENRTATLELRYSYLYNKGKDQEREKATLNLRLYDQSEFKRLINPYADVAESGPVKNNEMFFGRDELIQNMVDTILNSGSKCLVLYGQKRSGKSSVLHHVNEKIRESESAIGIKFSLGEIAGSSFTAFGFLYKLCRELQEYLLDYKQKRNEPIPKIPEINFEKMEKYPDLSFDDFITEFKRNCSVLPGWKEKKLIICLDEFTYLYTAIQRGTLKPDFMKTWKAVLEKGGFNAILIGQDVMPKFKKEFANEFGVTKDIRLTYLDTKGAKKLIEKPIWDIENNKSRYVGDAADRIIEWTAGNPYYLQMFCARLVDKMNANKSINITKIDVDEVADGMVKGSSALEEDKYDNLLRGGDADLEQFETDHVISILRSIAENATKHQYCTREQIKLVKSKKEDDKVLEDLLAREVIQLKKSKYYSIKVKLFERYLLS